MAGAEGVPFPKAPPGSSYAKTFDGLRRAGAKYVGSTPKGGLFTCPCHDDENASLEVDEGRVGIPILSCPPCEGRLGSHEAYMEELRAAGVHVGGRRLDGGRGLDWGSTVAVRPGGGGGRGGSALPLRSTHDRGAVYTYCHADGTENFRVTRWEPKPAARAAGARKRFVPMHVVPGVGRVRSLEGVERTPYRLERFSRWAGQVVYFVEGEKAADALFERRKRASTLHGGCKKEPSPGWTDWFKDFAEVRLWPDADEVGVAWMRRREAELVEAGIKVTWWGCEAAVVAASDDAYDCLERAQVPHRLSSGEVDALAALKAAQPLPEVTAVERRSEPLKVAGKALVPAMPWQAAGEALGDAGEGEHGVHAAPYAVAVNTEPYRFAEEMLDRHFRDSDGTLTLRYRHDDATFWLWNARRAVYRLLTEDEVKARVARILAGALETVPVKDGPAEVRPVKVKARTYGEVVEVLRVLTLTSSHGGGALLPSVGGVPFRNGWLNVATGLLEPIGPSRDVRWNVPAEYDPDARCPAFFAFLDSLGWSKGSAERRLLRQWFGYLLSGSTDQQKALLLLGPKRAGKGTILSIAEGLLGDGAVGTQLNAFGANFGLQNLIGKGLATIGDARFGFRTDKNVIERLLSVTGGDTMTIDVKNKTPVSVRLGARLMIATNESPKFIEASDALATRFLVLQFTRTFYGHEDLSLRQRCLSELPGIARWALGGYRELIGLGSFSETGAGLALQEQMIRDAAPIRLFVEEECVLDSVRWVESQALFDEYILWAERNHLFKMDRPSFFRDLNTAFPGKIEDYYPRVGKKQIRAKRGLALK